MSTFTLDETEVIRKHRLGTVCLLFAASKKASELQTTLLKRVTGRRFVPVTRETLRTRPLPASWMLAVLLARSDTTEAIAPWARHLPPADIGRIAFYEIEPLASPSETYRPWTERSLPDPVRWPVAGFAELNVVLGGDLNRRILVDHRPAPQRE